MVKMSIAVCTALVLSSCATAQQEGGEQDRASGTACCPMMGGGMTMGAMTDEQMAQMQEHMQEMQSLMQQIRQEDDPERRRQLMQEHRERMQEGMEMMHKGMMGRQTNGSPGMEMSMEERMRSMQHHMAMMQMMMDHMMERERQEDDAAR